MSLIRTLILHPTPCQGSSLAIAQEMLETANRLARYHGLPQRFEVETRSPPIKNPAADLIILPGLGLATEAEFHLVSQSQSFHDLVSTLQSAARSPAVVAGACSGCFALGKAGLLDGRQSTCSWWLQPFLQAQFPKALISAREILLDQGDLITAGAAFSQIDLMLHLVERFIGIALAEDCRRFLMADRRQSQLPYVSVSAMIAADPALQQAELFVRRHIDQPLAVADMAAAAGLGERTFARRLKSRAALTPIAFLQSLRITEAIRLAQSSQITNEEIAHRVGYSDASAFRRLIKKRLGCGLDSFRPQPSASEPSDHALG